MESDTDVDLATVTMATVDMTTATKEGVNGMPTIATADDKLVVVTTAEDTSVPMATAVTDSTPTTPINCDKIDKVQNVLQSGSDRENNESNDRTSSTNNTELTSVEYSSSIADDTAEDTGGDNAMDIDSIEGDVDHTSALEVKVVRTMSPTQQQSNDVSEASIIEKSFSELENFAKNISADNLHPDGAVIAKGADSAPVVIKVNINQSSALDTSAENKDMTSSETITSDKSLENSEDIPSLSVKVCPVRKDSIEIIELSPEQPVTSSEPVTTMSGLTGTTNIESTIPGSTTATNMETLSVPSGTHTEPNAITTTTGDILINTRVTSTPTSADDEPLYFDYTIHCRICKESLINRKPKLLPCLHSVCESCLEKLKLYNDDTDIIRCPLCLEKCEVKLVIDNLLVEDFDTSPQANRRDSDVEQAPPICTACEENAEASSYCSDCNEWLCTQCVQAHKRVRITKDHSIQPKESVDDSSSSSVKKKKVPTATLR